MTPLDMTSSSPAPVHAGLLPFAEVPARLEVVRRQLSSDQLFAGLAEIEIAHGDAVYRLRRTALGKLILTK